MAQACQVNPSTTKTHLWRGVAALLARFYGDLVLRSNDCQGHWQTVNKETDEPF
jgi:hypothetical protein